MKKIMVLMIAATISSGLFAQEKMGKMDNKMDQKMDMKKDGVMMKDGKMMVMKDGKTMMMDKDMTMKNGTMVMKDGSVKMKDGTTSDERRRLHVHERKDAQDEDGQNATKNVNDNKQPKAAVIAAFGCFKMLDAEGYFEKVKRKYQFPKASKSDATDGLFL